VRWGVQASARFTWQRGAAPDGGQPLAELVELSIAEFDALEVGRRMSTMKEKARLYAIAAHREQRYGERPYSFHLDAVAALAEPYGEDAAVVAYLHDTVEDTDVTLADIEANFGSKVAACVGLLTDESGATRKERKAKTYARLAQVTGERELALVVKVADRLANVRACITDRKESLWRLYQGEHPAFRKAAFRTNLCDPLWSELDMLLSEGAFDDQA
jgi:guanosine-3',5'-bis(diphosphate) 3'-pyrophosphohydrolase